MMVGDVERFNPAVNGIKQVVRTRKLWLAIALVGPFLRECRCGDRSGEHSIAIHSAGLPKPDSPGVQAQ